ncbi:hypothetical protein KKA14_09600 [bacterium]|nr:hypothetical protein [bacterium]
MKFNFAPIDINSFADLYIKHNPTHNRNALVESLKEYLEEYKNGAKCHCGNPIWVIGTALYETTCFTCLTGETDASTDFEIDEACR